MSKQKPKSYIDKILLNPKKSNIYSQMKPAGKDMNYSFKNSISFNIVENLAQFKNNEFSKTNLNLRLIGNLSFLFTKQKVTTTKNKFKEKIKNTFNLKSNQYKKVNQKEIDDFKILGEYECYIPTKRIPYFNKNIINDKSTKRKDSSKKIKKINNKEEKIPSNLRNINFFRPEGRFFSVNTVNMLKKKPALNVTNISDGQSEALSTSNTYNNTNYDDDNYSSENFSLIKEESTDNIFSEKIFRNNLKICPMFPKYSELGELIECPLEDAYPPEIRYNNFIKILNSFLDDDDNNEDYLDSNNNIDDNKSFNNNKNINNICNTLFNISPENSIININDINEDINNNYNNNNNIQRVFIVNPANYKPYKAKIQRTTSKSGKLIKVNNNIFSSYNSPKINKTSLSDENDSDDYKKDESIFAFFEDEEDKKINPSKKIDSKIKRLLPKTAKKFIEKMNEQYIFLMNEKFKKISQKLDEAKNFITEKPMIKKLFIQLLKELLLDIGISSKKFYEKLIKFTQYSKERNNFEHFMNIFDIILSENNKENLRFKFLLLLKIIESDDSSDQILDEKQINIFFDFIECDSIYIDKLCEILGEKLILRYKAIYNHENIDKSSEKKYIYRKIKIILDSFLCALDS
jgi:hypothetical protein